VQGEIVVVEQGEVSYLRLRPSLLLHPRLQRAHLRPRPERILEQIQMVGFQGWDQRIALARLEGSAFGRKEPLGEKNTSLVLPAVAVVVLVGLVRGIGDAVVSGGEVRLRKSHKRVKRS